MIVIKTPNLNSKSGELLPYFIGPRTSRSCIQQSFKFLDGTLINDNLIGCTQHSHIDIYHNNANRYFVTYIYVVVILWCIWIDDCVYLNKIFPERVVRWILE